MRIKHLSIKIITLLTILNGTTSLFGMNRLRLFVGRSTAALKSAMRTQNMYIPSKTFSSRIIKPMAIKPAARIACASAFTGMSIAFAAKASESKTKPEETKSLKETIDFEKYFHNAQVDPENKSSIGLLLYAYTQAKTQRAIQKSHDNQSISFEVDGVQMTTFKPRADWPYANTRIYIPYFESEEKNIQTMEVKLKYEIAKNLCKLSGKDFLSIVNNIPVTSRAFAEYSFHSVHGEPHIRYRKIKESRWLGFGEPRYVLEIDVTIKEKK